MPINYTPEGTPDCTLDDEAAARGRQIYAAMRAEMEAGHQGRLVVIDTNTGDYEIGDYHGSPSDLEITKRLLLRRPDARTWAELVGGQYVFARIPWRRTMESLAARHNELAHDSAAKAARDAAATCPHLGRMVQFAYTPEGNRRARTPNLRRNAGGNGSQALGPPGRHRRPERRLRGGRLPRHQLRHSAHHAPTGTRHQYLVWTEFIGIQRDTTVRLSWRQTMEWFGDLVKGTAND